MSSNNSITKRSVLSETARVFDPLGWLSPVIIQLKILFQSLWQEPIGWDDPIPPDKARIWQKVYSRLSTLSEIHIPRWLGTSQSTKIELHGFCDASSKAYAAAIYCRVFDENISIRLLMAKTRVAPLKQVSVARLELCGALLLAKLMDKVKTWLEIKPTRIHAWTDSEIVLWWLSDVPRRWNPYIGNRTTEILNSVPRSQWRHVPSEFNPADCGSRGIFPEQLKSHKLWWNGPSWLSRDESYWPSNLILSPPEDVPEQRKRTNSNLSCSRKKRTFRQPGSSHFIVV